MTPKEAFAAGQELRGLCTNVIGFYDLIDRADDMRVPVARRIVHQAHFTASSVRMAELVLRLMDHLAEPDDQGDA